MSTTPAAVLARLKVTYQGWRISRTGDGFTACRALDRTQDHCGHRDRAGDRAGAVLRRAPARLWRILLAGPGAIHRHS